MPKGKVYAVARGRKPGIYNDWDACKAEVYGFANARYRSFPDIEQAKSFIAQHGDAALISNVPKEATRKRKHEAAEVPDAVPEVRKFAKIKSENEASDESGFIVIWTDGSSRGNGRNGAVAGLGVFFGVRDPRNISERLAGPRQTNQRAELTAIIRALESVENEDNIIIKTDSQYSIDCFTKWHYAWIKNNWKNSQRKDVENKDLIQRGLLLLGSRSGKTRLVKVKAHIGTLGNEMADKLANEGALKPQARA